MAKRRKHRLSQAPAPWRLYVLLALILLAVNAIIARLFLLQVMRHQEYLAKASVQKEGEFYMEPAEGEIFLQDKDGVLYPAAINKHFPYVYAVPKEINNASATAEALSKILAISPEEILRRLKKPGDPYEPIASRLSEETKNAIQNLKLKGVYVGEEKARFYPYKSLASHVIGFVAPDETGKIRGRYGIESFYEDLLRGQGNILASVKDWAARLFSDSKTPTPIPKGANLILTIDLNIQHAAEKILKEGREKWKAKGGNIIVMEAQSGRILAMANEPTFDLNSYSKEEEFSVFLNQAVSFLYEPGSVFKPFTVAAGLEKGVISASTTYFDSGEVRIGNHVIRNAGNSAPGSSITITRLLERSYNVGAVFVARRTGEDFLRDFWLGRFGFEEKTGIDLPGEIGSNFRNLEPPEGREINFATASFGQGISLTPIKLIQAFGAFANAGKLLKPFVVDEIQWPDGRKEKTQPRIIRRVVSERTLEQLLPMLVSVVHGERGSGQLARIPGYRMAGKTGTGEIPFENGRGYSEKMNHTFVGFGPMPNPKFVILTRLEEPIGARYAEATAVPMFRDLMKFILQYYEIPPDYPEEIKQ